MRVGILHVERRNPAHLRQRQRSSSFSATKIVSVATIDFILGKGMGRAFDRSVKVLLCLRHLPKVVRALTGPDTIALARRHPNLIYKWQGKYLARSFRRKQRSEILMFHYEFMAGRVNSKLYRRLIEGKILLWQRTVDSELVTISLCLPEYGREGDLSLVLEIDSNSVYELSFTILPGSFIGIMAAEAMLVARIQGRKGQFDVIKRATKICQDVSPPYLLMAAAEGLASALEIKFAAGVGTAGQVSKGQLFNYESFWNTFSAVKSEADFYIIQIPISGRPLDQCNPVHRRRTQRKREFKARLADDVRTIFIQQYRKSRPLGTALAIDHDVTGHVAVPAPQHTHSIELDE